MPAPAASISTPTPAARPMFRPVRGSVLEALEAIVGVALVPVPVVVLDADAVAPVALPLDVLVAGAVGFDVVVVLELWWWDPLSGSMYC